MGIHNKIAVAKMYTRCESRVVHLVLCIRIVYVLHSWFVTQHAFMYFSQKTAQNEK